MVQGKGRYASQWPTSGDPFLQPEGGLHSPAQDVIEESFALEMEERKVTIHEGSGEVPDGEAQVQLQLWASLEILCLSVLKGTPDSWRNPKGP